MEGEVETSFSAFKERSRHEMDLDGISQDWIMMATPVPMMLILLLYGLLLILGPRVMETREPYKLKSVMRFYNIFQVVHNVYIIYSFIENPQGLPFIIATTCSFIDLEDETYAKLYKAYLYYSWNYLVSKQIDLLDTVFMVMRKKNSHITFLHVYHHVAMVFFSWLSISNTFSWFYSFYTLIRRRHFVIMVWYCVSYKK